MTDSRHRYTYSNTTSQYRKKTRTYVVYTCTSSSYYQPKLHHPDADEIQEIFAEIAAGARLKDVAAAHQLTEQRLYLLRKRYAADNAQVDPAAGAVRASFTPEELAAAEDELTALLESAL